MASVVPFDLFNEQFYLATNPDVASAVAAGAFSSGFQHFSVSGLQEGRTQISPFYNEQNYILANPDVSAAVNAGVFRSGLQHYFVAGFDEGRAAIFGSFFNESAYLAANPDVAAAVAAGSLSSGFQHYITNGQTENRQGTFAGTSVNDVINGTGNVTQILGVDINVDSTGFTRYGSFGSGEVDVLIGGTGRDTFILGAGSELPGVDPQPFYVDGGNNDYALIQNFTRGTDSIQLAGNPEDYFTEVANGNFNITTSFGDLVSIVQGVTSLSVVSQSTGNATFLVG